MAVRARKPDKKHFTVAQANATLPLVRAIVKDVVEQAGLLRDGETRLRRLREAGPGQAAAEQAGRAEQQLEAARVRLREVTAELSGLGVEIKDFVAGLVDFPAVLDGREVYLCWRLGEPSVEHWHELNSGFAGRQRLPGVGAGAAEGGPGS